MNDRVKPTKVVLPMSSDNFKTRARARVLRKKEESNRQASPDISARSCFPLTRGLVFCLARPTRSFDLNFLISGIGGISSGILTRIKEELRADDGQRSSLPLGKNQPLQYQGIAATAVSREIRQRRCGSWAKKKKKKIKR